MNLSDLQTAARNTGDKTGRLVSLLVDLARLDWKEQSEADAAPCCDSAPHRSPRRALLQRIDQEVRL
jgi:hypothetical protein